MMLEYWDINEIGVKTEAIAKDTRGVKCIAQLPWSHVSMNLLMKQMFNEM